MKQCGLEALHPELVFPKPPFRIEESMLQLATLNSAASTYLQQIRDWRAAVLEFVRRSNATGLTERARLALENLLSESWPEGLTGYAVQSPYDLRPFPATEGTARGSDLQGILQTLRWRAGTIDYLSDIWDVMGDPALDLDECFAIEQFLRSTSRQLLCHLCLTEFVKERLHPDDHACLMLRDVRSKWPANPTFKRWREVLG